MSRLIDLLPDGEIVCPSCGGPLGEFGRSGRERVYCSATCRHRGPVQPCEGCGAPAWPYPSDPARLGKPVHCLGCGQRASRLLWPRERILEKVAEWEQAYGKLPVRIDWVPGRATAEQRARFEAGDWPHYSSVHREFGGWPQMMEAYAASMSTESASASS